MDEGAMQLAERVCRGEREAEEELVDRYYPRIYAMAIARTGAPDIARDLCQEAMLAVLVALRENRLRDRSALSAYVCAAARNRINYYFRQRGNREETVLPADLEARLPNPEDALELAERRRLARRVLKRLGPGDRRILFLTCFEDMKPREIAARLKVRPDALRMRKTRALRRARAAFEDEVLRSRRQRNLGSER